MKTHRSMMGLTATALAILALSGPPRASAAPAPDEQAPKETPMPVMQVAPGQPQPVLPNVWQSRDAVTWKLDRGGVWASLGHSATVLTLLADGAPGKATKITATVWQVQSFEEKGRSPAGVKPLLGREFTAAELSAAKGKGIAFTLHVPGKPFRYCLMLEMNGTVVDSAAGKAFQSAAVRIAVIEFLKDPTTPTTSKWIEPTHYADTRWYEREAVKAPWCDGRPVGGAFNPEAATTPRFGSAAPRVIDAPEERGPKLTGKGGGADDAVVNELDDPTPEE